MFSAAACYTCHRFGNAGGMTGPDLTGAAVATAHDLLDQIINPSKEINEQFAPIVVTKNDGTIMSGVVVNLSGDGVTLNTDLTDPNQRVNVDRKEVKSIELSKVSRCPRCYSPCSRKTKSSTSSPTSSAAETRSTRCLRSDVSLMTVAYHSPILQNRALPIWSRISASPFQDGGQGLKSELSQDTPKNSL